MLFPGTARVLLLLLVIILLVILLLAVHVVLHALLEGLPLRRLLVRPRGLALRVRGKPQEALGG